MPEHSTVAPLRGERFGVAIDAEVAVDQDRLFELSLDLFCVLGFDGLARRLNMSWTRILGHPLDALMLEPLVEIVHPDDQEATAAEFARLAAGERSVSFENRCRCADGTYRWIHWTAAPSVPDRLVYAVARDVTSAKEADQSLRGANRELSRRIHELQEIRRESEILSEMSEVIQACVSSDEALDAVRAYGAAFFSRRPAAVYMLAPSGDHVRRSASWAADHLPEAFEVHQCWGLRRGRTHDVIAPVHGPRCSHVNGIETSVCAPMTAQGEPLGIVFAAEGEGTEDDDPLAIRRSAVAFADHLSLGMANLRLRDSLRNNAIRDPATGLYNRRYMEESARREFGRADRRGTPVGVLMVDIDHFKRFNDRHGHHSGDLRLAGVARYLQHATRAEDIVCRYGGEEFLIIMPEAPLDACVRRADELREGIADAPFQTPGGADGAVTVSIGVSSYPTHGGDLVEVLRSVDAALYQAKRDGRNRVVCADPDPATVTSILGPPPEPIGV